MSTRDFSSKQEKELAKKLNGEVQPNSGGTKFNKGDVLTDDFFIEAKTPTSSKGSFTIKKDWLHKMKEQAFGSGRSRSALAFRFEPESSVDWYVLSDREFAEYVELVEIMNKGE